MSDILNKDISTTTVRTGLEARKQQGTEDRQALEARKAEEAERESVRADLEARKQLETRKAEEKKKAEAEESKFKAENIQLDNGEWINKKEYEKLSDEEKNILKEKGIVEFNKYASEKQKIVQAEFESGNIKLNTGEYVSKEEFDKLSDYHKNLLLTEGIEKYNKEIEDFNKLHNEGVAKIGYYASSPASTTVTELYDTKGKLLNDFQLIHGAGKEYVVVYNGDGEISADYVGKVGGNLTLVRREHLQSYLDLINKLPDGWSIEGLQDENTTKYGMRYLVRVKNPEGQMTMLPINTAVSQLSKDGIIKMPEQFNIPPVKDLFEVIDKDSYEVLPHDYQGQTINIVRFKINGKPYETSDLYAIWYANLLKNIGEGKHYVSISRPTMTGGMWQTPTVLLTDKDGNQSAYTIDRAWNMVMTDGKAGAEQYIPEPPQPQYGSPYALPTSLGGSYGSVIGKSMMPTTPYQDVNVPFNPQIGLPELKDTLGIINELNQGRIKESELTMEQAQKINKEAVKLESGDYTLRDDYQDIYNVEVLDTGEVVDRQLFARLPDNYQSELKTKGTEGLNQLIAKDKAEFESSHTLLPDNVYMKNEDLNKLPQLMKAEALNKGYQAIDISNMTPQDQFEKMKSWGMIEDEYAEYGGVDDEGNIILKDGTPLYKKILTADFAKGAAIGMVPIAGTIYHWNKSEWWENGLSIALDIATFIPFTTAVSAGVRGGKSLTASVGRALLSEIKAPITAFTRPVRTGKTAIRSFETIMNPAHVPYATSTVRDYLLKVPKNVVDGVGDSKTAKEARDIIVSKAISGESPVMQFGNKTVELSKVALNQTGSPLAIHATPDITPFIYGTKVQKSKEGLGLFVAPSLPANLTNATAFGTGFVPTFDVGTFEWTGRNIRKIGDYRPDEIAKLDLPAIRKLDLSDSTNIPKNIAEPLKNYIKSNDGTIVGSFAERLRIKNAKQPHDVDLNFNNPEKARQDIANLARSKGYETQVKESAVLIKRGNQWQEIANVKGARDSFFKQHGIDYFEPSKVDGVNVIPLGEQYMRQGFGALAADRIKDIDTYKKRVEHMLSTSGELQKLAKEAGLTKRMRGALLIRDENVLKAMQPSDKLYRGTAEIESTIKPLTELPPISQILTSRDSAGNLIHYGVIGNPFTQAEINKLKLLGATDTIKDIFRPAMKIDGEAVKSLDELNSLTREARALEDRISIAKQSKNTSESRRLQTELDALNDRYRAISRNIDSQYAARSSLRSGFATFGETLDVLAYESLARENPQKLARDLVTYNEVDRTEVLNNLSTDSRTQVENEINRIPLSERQRLELEKPAIDRTGLSVVERSDIERAREVTDLTRSIPDRERIPTERAGVVTDRIVTETERIPPITELPPTGKPPIQKPPTGIPPEITLKPPPPEVPPPPPGEIKYNQLTDKQKESKIAWKQGVMYKLWYEPYGQKDIINSPYPIPGVQYEEGLGSAYRSMVAVYGELPRVISRDMGIQDITVKPTKDPNHPQLFFTEDRNQRTKKGRKIISKSRIIKKNGVRKNGLTFDTLMSI